MMAGSGNIFEHVLSEASCEQFAQLLATERIRIERIVSTGQASPQGFWYDQAWPEWVLMLSGSAGLRFGDEDAPRQLRRGDYLLIPAGRRHRVDWTDTTEPTIWLAIHFDLPAREDEAAADTIASGATLASGSRECGRAEQG
jgi:cupin 2 domain-containing protein